MPWTAKDTGRHNKRAAKSPRKRKVWSKVANQVLSKTGNEGRAIREANAVANRMYGGRK